MTSSTLTDVRSKLIDVLRPFIEGRTVALLDFPNHSNCGDSAIWLGEEAALAELGCNVVLRRDIRSTDVSRLNELPDECVLLLHGGGNFGDLYPAHQQFREAVLQALPQREIVQLPQSIYYGSAEGIAASARVLSAHPSFTLLTRDERSYGIATEQLGCNAVMCPDSALMLELNQPKRLADGVFVLARSDDEAAAPLAPVAQKHGLTPHDWYDARQWKRRNRTGIERRLTGIVAGKAGGVGQTMVDLLYKNLAVREVRRATEMIGRHRILLTDRLHAHILAELLGIEHVVVDTGYGKIRGFHDAWLAGSTLTHFVETADEGCELAKSLAGERQ